MDDARYYIVGALGTYPLPATMRPEKYQIGSNQPNLARAPFSSTTVTLDDGLANPEVYTLIGDAVATSEAAFASLINAIGAACNGATHLARDGHASVEVLRAWCEGAPIDQHAQRGTIRVVVVPKTIGGAVWR